MPISLVSSKGYHGPARAFEQDLVHDHVHEHPCSDKLLSMNKMALQALHELLLTSISSVQARVPKFENGVWDDDKSAKTS